MKHKHKWEETTKLMKRTSDSPWYLRLIDPYYWANISQCNCDQWYFISNKMKDFYGEPIGLKEYLKFQRIKNSVMNKYLDAKPGTKLKKKLRAMLLWMMGY